MKKKLFAISEAAILVFSVWSALFLDFRPALAKYSWTDTIRIYKDITVVCTDIRTITNNETFPIDVKVYVTSTSRVDLLQHYELSANQTDFIIISEGAVILSGDTYYGLEPGQKLCFTVKAKPMGSIVVGDTATVGIRVELYSALYAHDVAIISVTPFATEAFTGYFLPINVTVKNEGNFNETVNLMLKYDTVLIGNTTVDLDIGQSLNVSFTWDTTGLTPGNYTLTANAIVLESIENPEGIDNDPADNTLIDGVIQIKEWIPGDGDFNGLVELPDFYIWVKYFGKYTNEWPPNVNPDYNSDGFVDMWDFYTWVDHWGETDP